MRRDGWFTIYEIVHRLTQRAYVGCTQDLSARVSVHRSTAKSGDRAPLYCAIREYGIEAFDIIEITKIRGLVEARAYERDHTYHRTAWAPFGFNRWPSRLPARLREWLISRDVAVSPNSPMPSRPKRPAEPFPGHLELISRWPNATAFAKDAGVSAGLGRHWRRNGRIPVRRYDAVLAAAERRGFPLTYAELVQGGREEKDEHG